jgi:hypothetical protein
MDMFFNPLHSKDTVAPATIAEEVEVAADVTEDAPLPADLNGSSTTDEGGSPARHFSFSVPVELEQVAIPAAIVDAEVGDRASKV